MSLIFWIIIFAISLFILTKSSDYFIESAEITGWRLKIPKFVIGATIVALGTSLPELISSVIAVIQNASEIVAGNVIGSNITNILLILGVSGFAFKEMDINTKIIKIDLPILLISALLLVITIIDGEFSLSEGLIFILFLIFYILYIFNSKSNLPLSTESTENIDQFTWKTIITLIGSTIFIFLGAKYTIDSVINIAEILNIGKEIIAITAISLGTSLPELIVSLSAVKKNNPEMVLGNILGSNIFNTLAVMSIPALFGKLTIPESIIFYALPIMCLTSLILLLISLDKKISKNESILLIVFYFIFIAGLFFNLKT
ncbi:MAG: calcium/sodium antiporter [Vampirovibrionia bacterium]